MPFQNNGSLTSNKLTINDSDGWSTQTEWNQYQSLSGINIVNGSVKLAEQTSETVLLPQSNDLTNFSGNTSGMSILDTTTIGEVNSGPFRNLALMENNNGGDMRSSKVYSTSGLNSYPEAGDTFSWYQSEPSYSSDNGDFATLFAVQSADATNHYGFSIDPGDRFQYVKDQTYVTTNNPTINAGDWYEIEVTWGTGGGITGRLFEVNQSDGSRISEISSIQETDSAYISGGIGAAKFGNTGGGYAMQEFKIKV